MRTTRTHTEAVEAVEDVDGAVHEEEEEEHQQHRRLAQLLLHHSLLSQEQYNLVQRTTCAAAHRGLFRRDREGFRRWCILMGGLFWLGIRMVEGSRGVIVKEGRCLSGCMGSLGRLGSGIRLWRGMGLWRVIL